MPKLVLTALLIAQALAYYGLSRPEPVPLAKPLDQFPTEIGAWHMVRPLAMDAETANVLRADDYLLRDYSDARAEAVNLFVAFFKSQRAGQTPHSPKNCLPASGWVWTDSNTLRVTVAGRAEPIEINRYVVSKGEEKAVVLYWYQSRDRVVANEFKAAKFVAWDALRYNRTDTALVRVVAPVADGRADSATAAGVDFIQDFFATLRAFFPA
ncbi:MAG: exosortase C-terminal domain/associated protein EpsI [Bryobacteraceae bacterium]|jgi:EpsI family protein